MNYILTTIAFFLGIFVGVITIVWLTLIPSVEITPMVVLYAAGSLIALCALGMTIWQAQTTRIHNRLTNTPVLQLNCQILADENTIKVSITNDGLGPAKIKSTQIYLMGEALSEKGIKQVFLLVEVMFGHYDNVYKSFGFAGKDTFIPAGNEHLLFSAKFPKEYTEEKLVDVWGSIRNKAQIKITYQSIYGENYTLDDVVTDDTTDI